MSNNRIDAIFASLKEQGRSALIPFLTVGDPSANHSVAIIHELEQAGADLIELGVPYSDPLADGPVIQASSERALKNGITLLDCLEVAKQARREGSQLPFILFTYFNPVLQLGLSSIFQKIKESDIEGIIIPDLPYEEAGEVREIAKQYGVHLIPLVAPTSNDRVAKIVGNASGFIYCVSSLGVTGVRSEFHSGIHEFIESVRRATKLPIAIGFGISSREHVAQFEKVCEGVVVGSALVRKIGELGEGLQSDNPQTKSYNLLQIRDFVAQLKQ
ncbi:tryptophan synthase subunit alpha [Paenibacillus sp. N1-5-1-14]|uniref:tryptophan synthase subunit alpha n=1 Tax=Paenibacillus radicibacter TaxID=2972488 RepID=UPI002159A612|nr:tryptophan synthase subunit alpha [Paenibacillus radicibacter]MCR8642279.1 tryptophan synthase subunit alpha [Paenibacillus radicibacter]